MKGFERILKFKVFKSYENARKIADDIIVSLVNNSGLKTEDEKEFLPTYISTVRETFSQLLWIVLKTKMTIQKKRKMMTKDMQIILSLFMK